MRAVDIIIKKRNGEELSQEEIEFFIQGFTRGDILDYQVSAWAMAVLLQGMTARETVDLTQAIAASGDQLDLSSVVPFAVDKHSTGGVGDKTTLVVQPMVAACGVPVGKMSGRGLGFTGGTLDKMESVPGFRADLTTEQFLDQLGQIGMVLSSQTIDLAPADGKLYALRDVTGTVPAVPLIASSVMSKKIAAGAHAIVLDVKVGNGAFMQELDEAVQLAETMVDIGKRAGRSMVALISDMNQPLGSAVGNALEVREAIDALHGNGPADLLEHCLEVAGNMLMLAGKDDDLQTTKKMAADSIEDGTAFEKFKVLVKAQGGDVRAIEEPDRLPSAPLVETVVTSQAGFISGIHAREVGLTAMMLGAGRSKKGDLCDHAVGVVVHKKVGDQVERGDELFTVHARTEKKRDEAVQRLMQAHSFSESKVEPLPLFYKKIGP